MKDLLVFLVRLAINCAGMYLVISWFSASSDQATFGTALIAGIIFCIVNAVVKPFVKLLSLPFILVTMGLFVLVVNAAMIGLTFLLIPGLQIHFWGAVAAGLLMSVVNYLANLIVMPYNRPQP
jgi:putative membrane protein